MDYDDNEFQGQNLQLAGEGCSKVSPVLRPYALPKFEFDDSLQGHLRFDSLVENEVFLGITSQEDNQWIEEYSRGNSEIDFNSSAVESRRNNVWSEATSSESVEMLLKSVGQEERVVEETIIEQSDVRDEPSRLTNIMDPNLNQDDGREHVTHAQNTSVHNDFLGNFPGFTSQSQDSQISGGELDKLVLNEKHNSFVLEEKVDSTCDDVIQKNDRNSANESMDKELQEDPSVSRVEFRNPGSLEKVDASIEDNIKHQENSTDVPMDSGTMIVESRTHSVEKSLNIVPNVESVENLLVEMSIPFSEEPPILLPVASENAGSFELQAVHDGNTNLKNPNSSELRVGSLSDVQSSSVQETEHALGKDAQQVDPSLTAACLPSEKVSNADVIAGNNAAEIRSSEVGNVCMDQGVSFDETVDAGLPRGSAEMDIIEVVGVLDNQKNVESDTLVRIEPVSTTEPDKISSPDTSDGTAQFLSERVTTADIVADDQPKSPIFGVSLVHQDNTDKAEVGSPCDGNFQDETPQVENVVDSSLKNPSSSVEKEASLDLAKKVVHKTAFRCATPVESCNVDTNTSGQECSKTLEKSPCESSEKKGANSEARGLLDPKESTTEVNKSNKHQTSVDAARPSESDANHIGQDGGRVSSLKKPQSISPSHFNNIISTELSQSAKDKQEVTKGVTLDNAQPSKVTDDVKSNIQSVSSSSVTKEEKSFTFEVGKSAGLGQSSKGFPSYPTFQPSNLPTITEGPSMNSSSSQVDAKKLHEASLVSPQNPSGVKAKSERKTRRKSVGKESARKVNQPKESTPAKDLRKLEKSSLSLTPPTSQIIKFEEAKPNENIERSGTKSSGVHPVPSPKLPDLNNSTTLFQQPFTDNQQVQLRAQILVYGSLISGAPPEEPHMIAAFGQSDGGRTWEGVWRACLERLHVMKTQANPDTPMQSRTGNRSDQGTKHTSVQNKIPSSTIISPMIPLSSPLWNISTQGDDLQSSNMPRIARLDYHQPLSPLHPYQSQPVQNFTGHNPSWLSQGPFSGQWVASSPIPNFNTSPRFPALPITEAVKLNPVKDSGLPVAHSAGATIFPVSGQPSGESKSRKRKKGTSNANVKPISDPSPPQISPVPAPAAIHTLLAPRTEPFLAQNQTDSVAVSTPAFVTSKTNPSKFLSPVSASLSKVVVSEETLSKVEESKLQAEDAAKLAAAAAKLAAAAASHCQGVWSQLGLQNNVGLNSDDEAKLVSSAVSLAAAAAVAKVAAAAAKIASNVAEQFLSKKSESFDKAASASSKHAETVDAIVKAAELAADAVAQAGKIVAMGEPLRLSGLVEAGPEGYWKTPWSAAVVDRNLSISFDKKNVEADPNVSDKEILTTKCGLLGKQDSGNLIENPKMDVVGKSVSIASREKDMRKPRVRRRPDLLKSVGVISESEIGPIHTPKVGLDTLKENIIKEGCLVEVYKDDDKHKGAWFGANVLSIKDEKALVSYTEIQSDEGQLKEWVPLEVEGTEVPKIRIAHPMTSMCLEGTRKRRRTAVTDFLWSSGDQVDVWIQDRWREGVVVETNKIDVTSLTVRFPAHGETSVIRSWHVRPTLVWKDGKWIECLTSKERLSSQGDAPQEKRLKLGFPVVESKPNDGPSENVDPKNQEESRTLPLSTQESLFTIGTTRDNTRRPIRTGLQKDGPRVIFGVPKPGKKQKFMDVSKHYDKNDKPHDSVKFTRYLIPQAPGSRSWKTISRNDATKEKQAVETKSRIVKPRKPPIPVSRTSRDTAITNKTARDSAGDDENQSGRENPIEFGSSSNIEDPTGSNGPTKSERLKKRKFAPAKVEQSVPEHVEPRRSNRKIQPTSRLLEGLQSSMTISKIPAASHSSQRSHSKATPKGNTNNG